MPLSPRFLSRACAAAVVTVLSAAATAGAAPTVPGASWSHVTPAKAGLDGAVLQHVAQAAKAGDSNCLAVAREGKLAGEWYFKGTGPTSDQDIFSATKSITSVLIGIAQDEGRLSIADPASRYIPEWRGGPSAAVTIRDILANDSGREWSPQIDYQQLIKAQDRTAFAIGLTQTSAPGTVWAYNNSAIQTLQQVLAAATGEDVVKFAADKLFRPLGMAGTHMGQDPSGHAETFEGVQSNCRDMARFGTMMVNKGRWGAKQVVSSAYVKAATGQPSQKLNAAYGYLWWLNRSGAIASNPLVATSLANARNPKSEHGQIVKGAPDDLFWALGLGNQIVQVDPGSRTIVVRLGPAGLGAGTSKSKNAFGPAQAAVVVTKAIKKK